MYNYLEEIKSDVLDYINENKIKVTYENREEIEQQLNDDLFMEDSVTGNASGSYTFNSCEAQEYVSDNLDLLEEAITEFGYDWEQFNPLAKGFEYCDVTIRCYLLAQAISEALDECEE